MNLKSEYIVQLQGSSLVGDIFGQDAFLRTHTILKKLRENGQLKCFKWWCPTCIDPNSPKDEDLIAHPFSISFATVRRILGDSYINWSWSEPDSEWSVKSGDARNAAYQLLNSKSRPKWKVILLIAIYESEV